MSEEWLAALAGLGICTDAVGEGLLGNGPLPRGPAPVAEMLLGSAEHRLVGLLAGAVIDGIIEPSSEERECIAAAHERAMREVLVLEDVLLEAVAVLSAAGVEHRLLKGAALAHMIYDDPAERYFGDNDLWVPADQIDRALEALLEAGAARTAPALSRSFDRRFAKAVTLQWSRGTQLDLHRTLAAGPYGLMIDLEDLRAAPVEVLLGGSIVHTLPAELHLVHGALHVALGDVEPRLGNLRDVAKLARRASVSSDRVIEIATRWGCAAPVAVGLQATRQLGPDRSEIEQWADGFSLDSVDEARMATYRQRDGRYARQARSMLGVLGWRDRLAFSRALLLRRARRRLA